jgi:signal transduction histidine kinase
MLANQQLELLHDEKTKHLTEIMQQEAEKLDYFIRSFQRFSELEALTLLPTDAQSVIMQAIETHTFPSNIETSILCESDIPKVSADAIRLEEVIHDLLDNAIEACEDKGVITIHVDRCETPERGSGVVVTIMDTGTGIEPDVLPYITKPYFTTKPDGTGIGIPMALKTIESFSGTLEIDSTPKLGTTITIFLSGVSNEENPTC